MPVSLEINGQTIDIRPGASLFEHAELLGIRVPTSCRKQGKCRECLVEVVEGIDGLTPRTEEERHLRDQFRLSCRARLLEGPGVVKCHTLRRGSMRIEDAGNSITLSAIDPAVTRDRDWVLLDGEPVERSSGPLYGLAIDVGTTTVVIRLLCLESGSILASQSFENPQRFGGTDVMARIQFDTDYGGHLLQRTLVGYMTHAIEAFSRNSNEIYEVIIAGNTTMRDLFFGLDVYPIGQKPYRSTHEASLTRSGLQSRLPIHPKARVYGLPIIGSHVGADAAACLLAVDWLHLEGTSALMDIGTNTELIVGNRERTLAASCPAGPAFEGGGLSCGMPGLEGAIERVRLLADGGVEIDTIGDLPAEGICGSGLIEALGELLRTGRMNRMGRLAKSAPRLILEAQRNIYLSESDISHVAQAKGANVAGLHIVTRRAGIDFAHIDRFFLAGGFGRHLNLEASRRIGLIPDLPAKQLFQIGNAAVEGATIALLSLSRRRQLEQFVLSIEHVELETDPDFFDHFVEGCQFKPLVTNSHYTNSH